MGVRLVLTKLNICCGGKYLSGWLNTDLNAFDNCEILDLLKFPWRIGSESCSHVYCEQGIEHFELQDVRKILAECYRVLSYGGRVRMLTPDLVNLASINPISKMQQEVFSLHRADVQFPSDVSPYCFVLNRYMREWGHKFFWDFDSMRSVLHTSGFSDVKRETYGHSSDIDLCGLERHYEGYKPVYDFE